MTRYLFVYDDYVEAREGLSRIVHPLRQHPSNPLIVQDRPWECHVDCRWYPSVCMWSNSVLRDPETGKFRMWYTSLTTREITLTTGDLIINASAENGSLLVEALDPDGRPLSGLSARDCVPIREDGVSIPVRWKKAAPSPGRSVKLRFYLENAAIYSFSA